MPSPTPRLDRRHFLAAGLGALLAACAGEVASPTSSDTEPPVAPTPPSPPASPAPSPSASPVPAAPQTFDAANLPTGPAKPTGIDPFRIEIPAIGVDAPIVDLNLTAAEVEVPEDFGDAGWWVQTRAPGEIGPSVIGGHVDSKSGPAVFYRLRDLESGNEVIVSDEAGDTRTFVVDRVIQANKFDRPPEVFGFGEPRPELRVITCGGDFDPNRGHYEDNIIVFCHDPAYEA